MTFTKTIIHEFTIDRYDEVIAPRRRTLGVSARDADSRAAIERYLRRNPGLSFVAEIDGRITQALQSGYWASTRPASVIQRQIDNSLCSGAYEKSSGMQVGFARVITSATTLGFIIMGFGSMHAIGENWAGC